MLNDSDKLFSNAARPSQQMTRLTSAVTDFVHGFDSLAETTPALLKTADSIRSNNSRINEAQVFFVICMFVLYCLFIFLSWY
jgi:hypothetical protein